MIEAENVSKARGAHAVLNAVSMTIGDGETVQIGGVSGAGKTTLLRILAGLELPDDGRIVIDGRLATDGSAGSSSIPPHRRNIGMVFQTPALWPHMTVAKNVAFAIADRRSADAADLCRAILDDLGAGGLARHYPHQLAAGQARRVALARALAARPRYLFMDEPLVNLDGEAKTGMLDLILRQADKHAMALLYVTHDPVERATVGGRRLVLQGGHLLAEEDAGR